MNCVPSYPGSCPNSPSQLFLTFVSIIANSPKFTSLDEYPRDYSPYIQDQEEFDFIIVGGGTAGSAVANRLSQNPAWKILVLEAGGYPSPVSKVPLLFYTTWGGRDDWVYKPEPTNKACLGYKDRRCTWRQGKCLGGGSAIDAMIYLRGVQRDYDQWAAQGNPEWNYQSVLETFREFEHMVSPQLMNTPNRYGLDGVQSLTYYTSNDSMRRVVEDSGRILGYPTLIEEGNLGYFNTLVYTGEGKRASSATSFLGSAKHRPNLLVSLNTIAEKILIDETTKQALGVAATVTSTGRKLTLKARKEVILSAGGIRSPQILMLSGIGPKEHLQQLRIPQIQDLRVGENLHDHLAHYGVYGSISDSASMNLDAQQEFQRYLEHQTGSFAEVGLINLVGFINTFHDSPYGNIQLHNFLYPKAEGYFLPEYVRTSGLVDSVASIQLEANKNSATFNIIPVLIEPKSRGRLLLRSANFHDKPIIFANYLDNPEDIEVFLQGVKYAEAQIQTGPFRAYNARLIDVKPPGCERFPFRSDDYWRCSIRTLSTTFHHFVGTCKMGPANDPGAVVDSRLRVHGIRNLRVIDSSIMPNIVSVNIAGPTMMIGVKGGNMILEDWHNSNVMSK